MNDVPIYTYLNLRITIRLMVLRLRMSIKLNISAFFSNAGLLLTSIVVKWLQLLSADSISLLKLCDLRVRIFSSKPKKSPLGPFLNMGLVFIALIRSL